MSTDLVIVDQGNALPVTQADLDSLKRQRTLLKDFVSSQLREANFSDPKSKGYGEGDFGTIPGTPKPCLLQPGAQKILRLFGLGVRVKQVDKEIDRHANFAMFTYRAEVIHLKTGNIVAESEGTANSQEKKYKNRTVWFTNKSGQRESKMEETPIFDVLNTLMKMAQKRAMIGATIQATGASDFFTQDFEAEEGPDAGGQKPPTDKAPSAESAAASNAEPPICCEKPMMMSKYPDRTTGEIPWYCVKCKKTLPRVS